MSKAKKGISGARAWREKHSGQGSEFAELDQALAHWEVSSTKEQTLKADLKATRDQRADAAQAVANAWKQTKAQRKAAKASAKPNPAT
jgi:hypothetical protein